MTTTLGLPGLPTLGLSATPAAATLHTPHAKSFALALAAPAPSALAGMGCADLASPVPSLAPWLGSRAFRKFQACTPSCAAIWHSIVPIRTAARKDLTSLGGVSPTLPWACITATLSCWASLLHCADTPQHTLSLPSACSATEGTSMTPWTGSPQCPPASHAQAIPVRVVRGCRLAPCPGTTGGLRQGSGAYARRPKCLADPLREHPIRL